MILPTAKSGPLVNPNCMIVNLGSGQGAITSGFGQESGRSFVRYIDFKCSSGLAQDIVTSLTGATPLLKMYLYAYGSSATGTPTQVYLPYGFSTQSGTIYQPTVTGSYGLLQLSSTGARPTYLVRIDFGARGIGGYNAANTNDGVYVFKIDHLKDGTYSYAAKVHRLYGDVDGNRVVSNIVDRNYVINAAVYGRTGLYAENCDGSGQVFTGDTAAVQNNNGRTLVTLYDGIQI